VNEDVVGRFITLGTAPGATLRHIEWSADDLALGLAAALRTDGMELPVGRVLQLAAALDEVGTTERAAAYWAGRATLVSDPAEIDRFDRVFAAFWEGRSAVAPEQIPVPLVVAMADEDEDEAAEPPADDAEADDEGADTVVVARYSDREVVRHKDLARCSDDELAEAYRLMGAVRLVGAPQRSRRRRPSRRETGRLDLGRTVHDALGTGGEVLRRRTSSRTTRPRRVVILADISGSMDPYARAVLRFAQAAVAGRRRVEAFTLGTRLTRVTRELDAHDPDIGLARAMDAVEDWSGGTRLGDNLRRFNDEWGVAGLARGAVVVIVSDGWDQGDPDELGAEMARLARVAFRVVWVNPLKASEGYEPLARGMAAALPHVDRFVEGHSLAALDDLVEVIAS
jgi:uncharacterized protein with von Willebrand factor type A (vWA) domain